MIGVAFDLTGTLLRDTGLEQAAARELLRQLSEERGLSFDELRASEVGDLCKRSFAFENDFARSSAVFVDAVQAYIAEPAPPAVVLSRFRQIAVQLVPSQTEPLPGARETLAQIASLGIPCAILTNGWSAIEQRKARYLGFAGPVLVSEDIGFCKPHRAAFAALAETLALPPDRIWYVGGDPAVDVAGAGKAGLQSVWLRSEDAVFPSGLREPEHTIERIDDVLELLSEPYTRSLLGLRYVLHSSLEWRQGHFMPGVEYGLNDPASLTHLMPEKR
jgi:HAD superfamily hydrolase (TIGR01509 family)